MKTENNYKENKNENVAVSIIVAIYNMEKYLRRFLDSVVYQTLPNIEIILVNKESTDNSLSICEEYAQRFNDKVFVYNIPYTDTPAAGRNFGVSVAHGEYYYFCDADDLVAYKAMEWLYTAAVKENADMVCGYAKVVFEDGKTQDMGRIKAKEFDNKTFILANSSYWIRIIKRDLFKKTGNIPENTIFDDLCYIPFINQNAKKCFYIDKLVYYYFRRTSSTAGRLNEKTIKDSIWSMDHLLRDETNPYREEFLSFIASRINGDLSARYVYADQLIEYLKKHWREISENSYVQAKSSLYQSLERYVNLSESLIPKRIYINGFGEETCSEVQTGEVLPFYDKYETYVLDESNCDVKSNEWIYLAYQNKNYEVVGQYFALKEIYKQGGFYLRKDVIIDNPLNYLRIYPAFFSFFDETQFTDALFGALSGSKVIKDLLDTYEVDFYNDYQYPLAMRIRNILNVQYEVKLNGCSSFWRYPFAVLSPDMTVYEATGERKHFTHIDFSSLPKEKRIILPTSVFEYISAHTPMEYTQLQLSRDKYQVGFNKYQKENKNLLDYKKKYTLIAKDMEKLKKEHRLFSKTKEELDNRIIRVSAERDRLSNENDRISSENLQLLLKNNTYDRENTNLRFSNESLKNKLSWLVEERDRITKENDRIAYEIQRQTNEKNTLEKSMRELEYEFDKVKSENNRITEELIAEKGVLKEWEKLNEEKENLVKQIEVLKKQVCDMEHSTSWKLTKWIRLIGDFIRK